MKTITKALVFNLVLFSSVTFAKPPTPTREVILDNEQVEVVRLTYPAGTESGMHTHIHPNRSVYFVKGGKLELISSDADVNSTIIDVPTGKILFLPATTHNVKNIGSNTVILLEHEIK